jgi:hypothetical protein
MKTDAFQKVAKRNIEMLGQGLQRLQEAPLDPHARLDPFNLLHVI